MKSEVKIGITFLLALISLFIAIFFIKDIQFNKDGKYYVVQFSDLNNLMEGGHIKLFGGIRVGTVVTLFHDIKSANAKIIINDDTINKIIETQKPSFAIKSTGLLGEKYMLISFRNQSNYITKHRKEIDGEKLPLFLGEENKDLETIIAKLDKTMARVDKEIIIELATILKEIRQNIQRKEIEEIIKNVASSSHEFDDAMKNINKLIIKSNNSLIPAIQKITKNLENKNTPIGVLLKNEETGNEIKETIKNINELIKQLKKHPFISNNENNNSAY